MSGRAEKGSESGREAAELRPARLDLARMDLEELQGLGRLLDERPGSLHGDTVAMTLARTWLKVRGRDGATVPLEANAVQRLFERRRDKRNIVLKARQLGLTTWTAARFFLKTITRPGTLTLQVAHSQRIGRGNISGLCIAFWSGCRMNCAMVRCGCRGPMRGRLCFRRLIRSIAW